MVPPNLNPCDYVTTVEFGAMVPGKKTADYKRPFAREHDDINLGCVQDLLMLVKDFSLRNFNFDLV